MMESAQQAVTAISQYGFTPELESINIDITLNNKRLYGKVQSYSKGNVLDLHPSKESGKRILRSWIKHLALCGRPDLKDFYTTVFMGFGTGNQKWIRFKFAENATELLENLINIYRAGMSIPINLYINSGYDYQVRLEKYKDSEKAMKAALKTWSSDFNSFSENQDPYIQMLLGTDPEPDQDKVIEYSEKIYKPLISHMEVL